MSLKKIIEELDVHTIRVYRKQKDRFEEIRFWLAHETGKTITQDMMMSMLLDEYEGKHDKKDN
jgi:hypothetical protein